MNEKKHCNKNENASGKTAGNAFDNLMVTYKNESRKNIGTTQGLLLIYDFIIFVVVELLLLVVNQGGENLTPDVVIVEMCIALLCIYTARCFWRVYDQIWRYSEIQSYIRLLAADACAFLLILIIDRLLMKWHVSFVRLLAISCMCLLATMAIRMVYRYAYKYCKSDTGIGKILNFLLITFGGNRVQLEKGVTSNKIRIAIIGAGRVGAFFAEELLNNRNNAYLPICFIDKNPEKIGREIGNIPILSELKASTEQLEKYNIQEVVVALPQLSSEEKLSLYDHYSGLGYRVKVYDYPTPLQVTNGKRQLREFSVEELLFRKPIIVTNEAADSYYRDKVILITGGGGSIGSELCRQVAKMKPKKLVILDVYENGAYDLQQELKISYGKRLDVSVEIVSVCNRNGLEAIFENYRPNIVLNAAAHKHVPLMEHNCCEAVENNVFGTLNTVQLSVKYGVERMIMISTDKAVNPTNVMGATKRMCEMIVQCYSKLGTKTTFSTTRFGNVLGSAGSVIPLFKKQIANGGPITITDKRIIRYFMTISEASQLVLQSGAMAKNGELFVLDMGKPVKILDLAESMIKLSGLEPYNDIDIKEIGLRPGEKLYEELLVKTETLGKTENKLIFVEHDTEISKEDLESKLEILQSALRNGNNDVMKKSLQFVVSTYKMPEEVNSVALKSAEMKLAVCSR